MTGELLFLTTIVTLEHAIGRMVLSGDVYGGRCHENESSLSLNF